MQKKKEIEQDRTLIIPEFRAHLEDGLGFEATHSLLLLKYDSIKKITHLTIDIIKPNLVKKASCMLYTVKKHLTYQEL